MNRSTRTRRSLLSALALTLILGVQPALACSCHMGEAAQKLENSARVFLGTVIRVEHLGTRNEVGDENIVVYFDDVEPLKGAKIEILHTADNQAGCTGYWFKTDQRYLIYAFARGAQFDTMWCGGVIPQSGNVEAFDSEVAELGELLARERTSEK